MKKLVFTALAVVAFSGVAMANSVEVKEDKVFYEDCYTKAADYVDKIYDKDGTHTNEENNVVYQAYLAGCLKANVISEN
jgi:hypothetical protein